MPSLYVESVHHVFSQVQDLKQSLVSQRKELNDCTAEITSLKMRIEGARAGCDLMSSDSNNVQLRSLESYMEEIQLLQNEIEKLKGLNALNTVSVEYRKKVKGDGDAENGVDKLSKNNNVEPSLAVSPEDLESGDSASQLAVIQDESINTEKRSEEVSLISSNDNGILVNAENFLKDNQESPVETTGINLGTETLVATLNVGKMVGSSLLFYSFIFDHFIYSFLN